MRSPSRRYVLAMVAGEPLSKRAVLRNSIAIAVRIKDLVREVGESNVQAS